MSELENRLKGLFGSLPQERDAERAAKAAEEEKQRRERQRIKELHERIDCLSLNYVDQLFDVSQEIRTFADGMSRVTGRRWSYSPINKSVTATERYRVAVDSDEGGYIYDNRSRDRQFHVRGGEARLGKERRLFAGYAKERNGASAYAFVLGGHASLEDMVSDAISELKWKSVDKHNSVFFERQLIYTWRSGNESEEGVKDRFEKNRQQMDRAILYAASVWGKEL